MPANYLTLQLKFKNGSEIVLPRKSVANEAQAHVHPHDPTPVIPSAIIILFLVFLMGSQKIYFQAKKKKNQDCLGQNKLLVGLLEKVDG